MTRLTMLLVLLATFACDIASSQDIRSTTLSDPTPRETVLGTVFLVRREWDKPIEELVTNVRAQLNTHRAAGKVICYISTPLSSAGGGHRPTNVEISKFIKRRLDAEYGATRFWALAPGVIETELPAIGGQQPSGGEYMYMWTRLLAGDDGTGADFDMVYFVGPSDMRAFFGTDRGGVLENLDQYVTSRAEIDDAFRNDIALQPDTRRAFIRYYGTRSSIAYSKGGRDEWNIFRLINRRRSVTDKIAVFFDGSAVVPASAETPIEPGYEQTK